MAKIIKNGLIFGVSDDLESVKLKDGWRLEQHPARHVIAYDSMGWEYVVTRDEDTGTITAMPYRVFSRADSDLSASPREVGARYVDVQYGTIITK